jgi:hypothetical protein
MIRIDRDFTMTILRITLGLVVLERSWVFVFASDAAPSFAHTGWPDGLRLTLGWCEIAAAVLFLVPRTVVAGGYSLIVIFVLAAALHLLHGEYDVGALGVWTVAVIAILAHRRPRQISFAGQ